MAKNTGKVSYDQKTSCAFHPHKQYTKTCDACSITMCELDYRQIGDKIICPFCKRKIQFHAILEALKRMLLIGTMLFIFMALFEFIDWKYVIIFAMIMLFSMTILENLSISYLYKAVPLEERIIPSTYQLFLDRRTEHFTKGLQFIKKLSVEQKEGLRKEYFESIIPGLISIYMTIPPDFHERIADAFDIPIEHVAQAIITFGRERYESVIEIGVYPGIFSIYMDSLVIAKDTQAIEALLKIIKNMDIDQFKFDIEKFDFFDQLILWSDEIYLWSNEYEQGETREQIEEWLKDYTPSPIPTSTINAQMVTQSENRKRSEAYRERQLEMESKQQLEIEEIQEIEEEGDWDSLD